MSYHENLSLTLNESTRSVTTLIYPVSLKRNDWLNYDPILYGLKINIYAYSSNAYEDREISVYINGDYADSATLYYTGYNHVYISYDFQEPISGSDLRNPINITIVIDEVGSSESWSLTITGTLIFHIYEEYEEELFNNVVNGIYALKPLNLGTFDIALLRSLNYTYSFSLLYPLLSGGLFRGYYMLNKSNSKTLVLQLTKLGTYNPYKITVCFLSMCKAKIYSDDGGVQEYTFTLDREKMFVLRSYAVTQGFIPISVKIERTYPISNPDRERITLIFSSNSILKLYHVINAYGYYTDKAVDSIVPITYTTLFDRDVLMIDPMYKPITTTYTPTITIDSTCAEENGNCYKSSIVTTRLSISSISVTAEDTNLKIELKPLVINYLYTEPTDENYRTIDALTTYDVLEFKVEVNGLSFENDPFFIGDYEPGWGSELPEVKEILSRIITVMDIGLKASKYISRELAEYLSNTYGRAVVYVKVAMFGYEVLKASGTNEASCTHPGDEYLKCSWERAILGNPADDEGMLVKVASSPSYNEAVTVHGTLTVHIDCYNIDRTVTVTYPIEFRVPGTSA